LAETATFIKTQEHKIMPAITNNLPVKPAVKIVVDGLFVLCMNGETNMATLGVYEHSADHRLTIRICKKEHGSPEALTLGIGGDLVRNLDDQNEIITGDISITIPGRAPNIQTYQHHELEDPDFSTDPRDLKSKVSTRRRDFEPDFRWIIDLEGERFHNRELTLVPQVINRKIRINQGVFYTENLIGRMIKQAYEATAKAQGIDITEKYYYVTTQMAIAIDAINANETLNISYGEDNNRQTITLPTPGDNSYYEICAINNCSLSNANLVRRLNDRKTRHSDFQNWYNLIDLPVAERKELLMLPVKGSNRFPCDLILLGRHSDLP
jgi:hypothetical protein